MLLDIHEPGQEPAPAPAPAVGIDLGTTNSVVATAHGGVSEVLRDADGSALVPSVVAYGAGAPVVGAAALDPVERGGGDLRAGDVVSSIKRLMGRGADDIAALAGSLPYRVLPGDGMARLEVGGRALTPVEISADILRALRARAETALGEEVTKAVVTVPAYFDDAARTATRDAARLAGLETLRLVSEPTAAALAYGLDKAAEGLYAVFDLGGGTFDVSILRLEKGVFQVLATGGDAALGGDDFDRALAAHLLAARGVAAGALDEAEVKSVLLSARRAKESLTVEERATVALPDGGAAEIDRTTFEGLIAPLVERAVGICASVLEDADLSREALEGVVLVGGATRVPLVAARVAALFGRAPLADIDPDEVVARGAALQAEALTAGSDTLLLDVTPLSLGIETMGGLFERIVPRNTPIPAARAQDFTTYSDGQTGMSVHVLQGERETVDRNRSLARFELTGIPPMVAGAARIRVTFAVDADGLLTVGAREETTGTESAVEVKPSYGLADGEIERMLYDSMEHARDDATRRLLAESRVEAERMIAATRAALADDASLLAAGEGRRIEAAIGELERAVAGDDRELIDGLTVALDDAARPFAQKRMDRSIAAALEGRDIAAVDAEVGG